MDYIVKKKESNYLKAVVSYRKVYIYLLVCVRWSFGQIVIFDIRRER